MASAAWEVLDVSVEHANPWFQVWRRQVRLPDGSLIRYFSAQYDRSAVGVLALNAGKALLVRQYRVLIDREVWAIPAGGVDVGETSLAAAGRELLEETGHAALALRPLIAFYPTMAAAISCSRFSWQSGRSVAASRSTAMRCWKRTGLMGAR